MATGTRIAEGLVHACAALALALLLFAAAGPLATDDLWWHLSLGRLFAESGPLLDADPRLHTALGPPHPNAWLGDVAWDGLVAIAGLDALRALHAALLLAIVALAWDALRRAARSTAVASLGVLIWLGASAYRLLQLRPELWTILLALVVHRLVAGSERHGAPRLLAAVALCGLWANLHPGFVLGPALLLATTAGHALAHRAAPASASADRDGAGGPVLALASGAGFLATALNPLGFGLWTTYAGAGAEAVGAGIVLDEWRPLDLFAWPSLHVPPSPAAWATSWSLAIALGHRLLRDPAARRPRSGRDWTEAGLAAVGWLAPLVAVRFTWLGLWPMLFVARGLASGSAPADAPSSRRALALATASAATLALFIGASGWRVLAPPFDGTRWRATYDADRYFAHAAWFLDDVGADGHAFHVYSMGGFLGYWLGPPLQTFVDGSLNVPEAALRDYGAVIAHAAGSPDAPDPTATLDRWRVDWVVGVGLPRPPPPGRPWRYTTTLLEGDARWIPVYRGLRSAVYLRDAPHNIDRLDRIAEYYERSGVPFDRGRGLLVERALDEATDWSIRHGVAPVDWSGLRRAARLGPPARRALARNRLAWTYAVLGRYASALAVDATPPLATRPALAAERLRRRVWCWLQLGRVESARQELDAVRQASKAWPGLLELARTLETAVDATGARAGGTSARRAFLPLSPAEAGRLKAVERRAPVRRRAPRRAAHDQFGWKARRSPAPNM